MCNIYTANKYINSEPMDYSNTHILDLKTCNSTTQQEIMVTDNSTKAKALATMFFPSPPSSPVIPPSAYPKSLKAKGFFTKNDIRKAIKKLKLYKAPGTDGIQNIVLQECAKMLINNLYYIYCMILELNAYPSKWLTSLTVVLWKPGKATYDVTKVY